LNFADEIGFGFFLDTYESIFPYALKLDNYESDYNDYDDYEDEDDDKSVDDTEFALR
jgi:hypothetical protein